MSKPKQTAEPLKTADQINREAGVMPDPNLLSALKTLENLPAGSFTTIKLKSKDCAKCKSQIEQETAQKMKTAFEENLQKLWQQFNSKGDPTEDDSQVTEIIYFVNSKDLQKFWERFGVK